MKPYIRNTAMKAIILSFVAMLTILQSLPGRTAVAAPADETGIEIQSSAGYQGEIKGQRWFPAHFTLTNRTGRELSGELVVSVLSSYNGSKSDYSVKAELPMDTPITLSLALPSSQLGKTGSLIRFFENSAESGRTVKLLGNNYLSGTLSESNMIGIVARDPDTLNFMPMLNQKGYSIKTLPLQPEQLPEDSLQLNMLDVLLLNDVASDGLSEGQQEAITEWVSGGGTLILSGGAGYEKTAGPFQAIAPVTVQGTRTITSTDSLSSYVGGKKLVLQSPLTVSSATIGDGTAQLMEGEVVLAAQRSMGLGKVLYVAFDPSLEPMASWGGSAGLWAKLMGKVLQNTQAGVVFNHNGYSPYWELQSAVNMFPSINNPQFMMLLYLFLGYVFIVAPLLFVLLKRMDRREWAWWIIPTIAIISTVTIFFVGASDKNSTLAHTIRVMELNGKGEGTQFGASSVFIPTGGDVRMSFHTGQAPLLYENADAGFSGPLGRDLSDDTSLQLVTRTDQGTEIRWNDVPYWSTRRTFLDQETVADTGQLEAAMENSDKGPILRVANKTNAGLSDVHLIWNGQVVKIGDLEIGKSGSALVPVTGAGGQQMYQDYGSQIFPYTSSSSQDTSQRERILLNVYLNSQMNAGKFGNTNRIVVVGFSKDTEPFFQVNGQEVKSNSVTLWAQKVDLNVLMGDQVSIMPGMIIPELKSTTIKMLDQRPNGTIIAAKGELVFSYMLPDIEDVVYDKLMIHSRSMNANPTSVKLSIWNEKQGKWAEMTGNGSSWELQSAQDYMSKDRTVLMRFDVLDDIQYEIAYPQIALEGKVKR
ncbi:hypothetical protein PAECIP111893_00914 [Paenibacillus plantiphilus]|uniref:Glutamine amidotransferase domain-containing protein n=1 Tax=Paenibacillus plantiphilus TaxID=2905650 RepID=A0ABM9BYA5_9BACL|nr:hypothetical protein [Paenibacillus plantiphilus]CAH1197724.1 hypothetical protein PAECIP111893_00914 [Paenibacillus plantiphilus]